MSRRPASSAAACALAVGALLAVHCQVDSPASARAECSSDASCILGTWTADCCPRCKPFSAPTSEVLALDDRCRALPPPSTRCPDPKCPEHQGPDFVAKCVAGQCVVGP